MKHLLKNKIVSFLITTVGKLIFNEILPESFPYINEPTNAKLEEETPEEYFVEKGAEH